MKENDQFAILMYLGNITLMIICLQTLNHWLLMPQCLFLVAQFKFMSLKK